MTLKVFSNGPYYDDFNESKGFYRILFKPGVAVQARELTQLQTMLQKQIERHGSSIFAEGSIVLGGQTANDFTCKFVRVNKPTTVSIDLIVNRLLVGATSGAQGRILTYEDRDDGYYVLYYKDFGDAAFVEGENLLYQPDPLVAGTVQAVVGVTSDDVPPVLHTGKASLFSIDEGVFYSRGNFVFCSKQTIPVANDTATIDGSAPSVRCGLKIVESVVDADDDTTLLDPSIGTYNYAAPGADRYKIDLQLSYRPLLKQAVVTATVNETTGVVEALTIVDGGNGYNPTNFTTIPVSFVGSTLDGTGNGAVAIVTSVDADSGAITSIALTNGGAGFRQSTVAVTISQPQGEDTTDFIELAVFDDGALTKDVRTPFYSVIGDTMARRTYDESGDYTVIPFNLRLDDHASNPAKFMINVERGKAYVKGYEIEKISTTKIENDRARDASHQREIAGYNLNAFYGSYITVQLDQISKVFDPTTTPTLNLYDSTPALIGTADLVYISWDSGTGSTQLLRFHLANLNISAPAKSIADVEQIQLASDATTLANVGLGASPPLAALSIQESSASRLVFKLPQSNTKTLSDSLDFSYKVMKTGTLSGGTSTVTISQTGGIQFEEVSGALSDKAAAYTVYNTTTGVVIPLDAVAITTTFNGSTATATFTGASLGNTGEAVSILAKVSADNVGRRSKTKVTNFQDLSVTPTPNQSFITLSKWDGYRLVSVIGSTSSFDYTARFSFDNGQRDANYDYARIVLKPGSSMPNEDLDITFDYFDWGGTGAYFTVDSYPNYDEVPLYVGKGGQTFNLIDCIDFRSGPTVDNLVPDPFTDVTLDFTYYVGRIDRLVLNKDGNFKVIKGLPDANPKLPTMDAQSMSIATLTLAPYTQKIKTDVAMMIVDNKRYTMRDIGVLDARIGRLEYYQTLSLLEKAARDLQVLDANGLNRFKNGLLVDQFQGHSVSDVTNPDFYAGINMAEQFMTCPVKTKHYLTRPNHETRTNVAIGDKLATLTYKAVPFLTQGLASRAISVNPFNVTAFIGKMVTEPPSDYWKDIEYLPDIVTETNGNWDAVRARSLGLPFPTPDVVEAITWGSWSVNFDGWQQEWLTDQFIDDHDQPNEFANFQPALRDDGTQVIATRRGKRNTVRFTNTVKTDTKVVDTSVIPWMRRIDILFCATGMKPNTLVYPFFDGVDIFQHMARCDVLKVSATTGGLAVPTIKAFEYPFGMAQVSQDTGSGVARGRVLMIRNGYMHVLRDARSPIFVPSGNDLEFRYNVLSGDGTLEEYNTEFSVATISLSDRQEILGDNSATVFNLWHTFAPPLAIEVWKNGTLLTEGVAADQYQVNSPTNTTITFNTAPLTTDVVYVFYPWTLKSDASGCISGVYTVPVNTFHTGDRLLRLIDEQTNDRTKANTVGEYVFSSFGLKLIEQKTITTTRIPVITTEEVIQELPMWHDPLAQSFLVDGKLYPNGIFLDSVDLCFMNKDPAVPCSIEIRPMVNGYPHSGMHIPGSKVEKDSAEVNTTNGTDQLEPLLGVGYMADGNLVPSFSDPRTVTNFKFSSPVHLKPNTEYCLVVMSNSNLYETFIAEIGATQLGSTQMIAEQPYAGSLFKSQNASTWTAAQEADMMFKLNRCEFDAAGSFEAVIDGFVDVEPFDYDLLWVAATNVEFNGVAEVAYGLKTTVASTGVLDPTFSSFLPYNDLYFNERRRLQCDSTETIATTGLTTYDLPFLNENRDTVDVFFRDDSTDISEQQQNKVLYKVEDKPGSLIGEKQLLWQSTVIDPPVNGNIIRWTRGSSVIVKFDLATSDPYVSPVLDLSLFTMRFIQNQIDDAGITETDLRFPIDTDIECPAVTVAGGGTGALIALTVSGGTIIAADIVNGGNADYTAPTATVTGGGGAGGALTLTTTGAPGSEVITGVTITNAGAGYGPTSLTITSTTGSGALVYPTVKHTTGSSTPDLGEVVGWQVDNTGSGYLDDWSAGWTDDSAGAIVLETNTEPNPVGGNVMARYLCRRVELKPGFDAEDIKVYLSAMKPQGSGIHVYYKVLASDDGTLWSDRDWVKMEAVADVSSTSIDDYQEMEFGTVGGSAIYGGFTGFKFFAIKICLTAVNTAQVPRVQELRVIALDTAFNPI